MPEGPWSCFRVLLENNGLICLPAILRARDIIPRRATTTIPTRSSPGKRAPDNAESERPVKRERRAVSGDNLKLNTSTHWRGGSNIQGSSSTVNGQAIDVKPDVGVLDLTNLDDEPVIQVKRERRPVLPIVPGEVIDLT